MFIHEGSYFVGRYFRQKDILRLFAELYFCTEFIFSYKLGMYGIHENSFLV
jgi:hypothetical protein